MISSCTFNLSREQNIQVILRSYITHVLIIKTKVKRHFDTFCQSEQTLERLTKFKNEIDWATAKNPDPS